MRPGRELDTRISREIFGYEVFVKQKIIHERTPAGPRPLRNYSKDMAWAWQVAEAMKVTLIPIENGTWFAMAGTTKGWESPAEFLTYLQKGEFVDAGAAVGEDAPLTICLAALKASEARRKTHQAKDETPSFPQNTEEVLGASG